MEHIVQFRVLNPHQWPFIKGTIARYVHVLQFQNFTQGMSKSKIHA